MKNLKYEQSIRLMFNHNSIRASFKKLEKSIISDNIDDQFIYTAIGELLLWVVTTDEWHQIHGLGDYKKRRNKNTDGEIIFGMRHAFNMLKHNMAFFQIHRKNGGLEFPMTFPIEKDEITVNWMPAGDVLNGKYPEQKENYINYLEGKDVLETFSKVITFLNEEYTRIRFD